MEELLRLTKLSLSIAESSTLKDDEVKLLINAAIKDLQRQGIKATTETTDELTKSAIIMFVKSNFGNTSIDEKERAGKTYSLLCHNLGLSEEYEVLE
jgi:hypothetical protein